MPGLAQIVPNKSKRMLEARVTGKQPNEKRKLLEVLVRPD